MEIKGIDISKYQAKSNGTTKVDFKALRSCGYEFVIIRAGFGMYDKQKDPAFDSHYINAKAAGLHIGAYHYTYARNETEAHREAQCFLKWIADKKLDYPIALDVEDESLKKGISTKQRTDTALAFLLDVESAGYYTMLYCSADWAKNYLDMDRLKHFDVWLACYTTETRRKELYKRETLGMWQYTSALKLSGVYPKGGLIPSKLDGDIAYKDYAAIIKKAGLNNL